VKIKQILSNLFWLPISSKTNIEICQEQIRHLEWNAVKHYIPKQATFLDVGCGAGYSLMKAYTELECEVQGIDPDLGVNCFGRFTQGLWKERPIIQVFAETLTFLDTSFDVVYSSYVLEDVNSVEHALQEMKRVLKPNRVLIIGTPTCAISWVGVFSSWFFTTHISIYHFVRSIGSKEMYTRFVRIFVPTSHSAPRAKYVIYDLFHFRISNWKKTVGSIFKIKGNIAPGLYPYSDYIQWFPLIKKGKFSSSVFLFVVNNK
jgi:SAM-dependent methyltransferase